MLAPETPGAAFVHRQHQNQSGREGKTSGFLKRRQPGPSGGRTGDGSGKLRKSLSCCPEPLAEREISEPSNPEGTTCVLSKASQIICVDTWQAACMTSGS